MIDIRKLLLMIQEQKQMNANLSLEFDCIVENEDPKPLVKVINYIINYLNSFTQNVIEISLNAYREGYMLSFAVFTEQTELPEFSDKIEEILQTYNATLKKTHDKGKYFQIIITFA